MSDKKQNVIVSDDTRAYFGSRVIDFLGSIAQPNQTIVIATPVDAEKPGQLQQVMSQAGLPANQAAIVAHDVTTAGGNAFNNLVMGANGPVNLTSYGRNDSPAESYAAALRMPPNTFSRLAPMTQDLRAHTLFHEISHGERDRRMPGVLVELAGDLGANDKYRQALAQGVVTNPDVPDAKAATRLIQAMTRGETYLREDNQYSRGAAHDLASLATTPVGASIKTEADARTALSQMNEAQRMVMDRVATVAFTDQQEQPARFIAAYKFLKDDRIPLAPEEKERMMTLYNQATDDPKAAAALKEAIDGLKVPPGIKAEYDAALASNVADSRISAARQYASAHPEALLQAAREVQASGALNDKPYASAFVGGFVSSAVRFAPEHYGVKAEAAAPTAPADNAAVVKSLPTVGEMNQGNDTMGARNDVNHVSWRFSGLAAGDPGNSPAALHARDTDPSRAGGKLEHAQGHVVLKADGTLLRSEDHNRPWGQNPQIEAGNNGNAIGVVVEGTDRLTDAQRVTLTRLNASLGEQRASPSELSPAGVKEEMAWKGTGGNTPDLQQINRPRVQMGPTAGSA